MTAKFTSRALLTICLMFTAAFASAQTVNLLKNPSADDDKQNWRAFGNATVEETSGRGRSFVVRNGGYFIQDVQLPEDAVGRYAVLAGWASSERINRDGANTGLPSLYGYMMNAGDPRGGRINAYLQGQQMRSSAREENQWTRLWGIFRIPPGTGRISLFLQGSAARFDDLGIYIFQTQAEARAFIGPSASADVSQSSDPGESHQQPCTLPTGYSHELHGVRLGMSLGEVIAIYPGNAEDENVRRVLEQSRSKGGVRQANLFINPAGYNSQTSSPSPTRLFLRFLDNRVYSIYAEYNRPSWKNVNDFIATRNDVMNLPSLSAWESVGGYGVWSKYLICNGVEIRFYAAPPGSPNANYISITDTVAELALNSR